MSNLKQLKEMMDTKADKNWFKKFGSPKSKHEKGESKKNEVVSKMNSKGCLAKAEKGEKPVTGKAGSEGSGKYGSRKAKGGGSFEYLSQ